MRAASCASGMRWLCASEITGADSATTTRHCLGLPTGRNRTILPRNATGATSSGVTTREWTRAEPRHSRIRPPMRRRHRERIVRGHPLAEDVDLGEELAVERDQGVT